MSTRCNIAYIDDENKVHQVYCHFDGYLEGVGQDLWKNYSYNDVVKLVSKGNMSYLEEPYTDMGESFEDNKPKIFNHIDDALKRFIDVDYMYVCKLDGTWLVNSGTGFELLTNALERIKKESDNCANIPIG